MRVVLVGSVAFDGDLYILGFSHKRDISAIGNKFLWPDVVVIYPSDVIGLLY